MRSVIASNEQYGNEANRSLGICTCMHLNVKYNMSCLMARLMSIFSSACGKKSVNETTKPLAEHVGVTLVTLNCL